MKNKFKKGDRIKFIKNCSGYSPLVGATGIITELGSDWAIIDVLDMEGFEKEYKHNIEFLDKECVGYTFLKDVFDSVELAKKWWEFWK